MDIKERIKLSTIKEHFKQSAKEKAETVGIKLKDRAVAKIKDGFTPQSNNRKSNDKNNSPENYATDTVSETAERVTENTYETGKKVFKSGTEKAKEKIAEKKAEKQAKEEIEAQKTETEDITEGLPEPDNTKPESEQYIKTKEKVIDENGKEPKASTENKNIRKKEPQSVKGSDVADETSVDVKDKNGNAQKPDTSKMRETDSRQRKKGKSKPKEQSDKIVYENDYRNPRQKKQNKIKTRTQSEIKQIKSSERQIKSVDKSGKAVRQSAKSTENVSRTIKTVDNSFKTAEKSAASAKKTAERTAKAAKRAEKTTRELSKDAIKLAQATAKAIAEGTKAAVAAGKEVVAAVIAGGPVVIVIIVICLIAAIGGTCFGIFLSNDETTGTESKMTSTISTLTTEYYNSLTAMKLNYVYDTIEIQGNTTINWRDVLAIYAVKYTNGADGFDVATLNDVKIEKIREIMKAMNPCTGVVVPKVKQVTVVTTDANGNKVEQKVNKTQKVLVISAIHISAATQAQTYHFTDEQKKQLNELLSADYEALWNELIGSGDNGGEIINTGSSHTPKSIFSWPLEQNNTISSSFGTRTDPITGVTKLHGGTDIAAAQGTPILAAADGTVVTASYDADGYGFYVKIKHNATYSTLYGHCSVLHVSAGQTVKKGQVIAEVGSTGHSTGPHVHFEVIQNGTRVNAMNFFK